MNFLSGYCLARYGRVVFWNTSCCKDIFNSVSSSYVENIVQDLRTGTRIVSNAQKTSCRNKFCLNSRLIMWTQVRFNKSCSSRLHRDLEFPNFDVYRKDEFKDVRKTTWGSGDDKPGYSYVITFFGLLCASYCAKSEVTRLVSYMAAAADVLAMASIEVELSKIAPGACVSYKWRGKPLFIKHRTPVDIEIEATTPLSSLRDPQTEEQRTSNPEWLIVIGICTHLGCVPIPNSGDFPGGFYCPCHGSHYDNIGRARKGPAPLNLEVPPYKFISDSLVLVG